MFYHALAHAIPELRVLVEAVHFDHVVWRDGRVVLALQADFVGDALLEEPEMLALQCL
jgi:hypothetical protein